MWNDTPAFLAKAGFRKLNFPVCQGIIHVLLAWREPFWDKETKSSQEKIMTKITGFPGGFSGKEPTCQCKRPKSCRFNLWVGKIRWRREWQPAPTFLPGKSHGQRSPVGNGPQGTKELDMTQATWHTAQSLKDKCPKKKYSFYGSIVMKKIIL